MKLVMNLQVSHYILLLSVEKCNYIATMSKKWSPLPILVFANVSIVCCCALQFSLIIVVWKTIQRLHICQSYKIQYDNRKIPIMEHDNHLQIQRTHDPNHCFWQMYWLNLLQYSVGLKQKQLLDFSPFLAQFGQLHAIQADMNYQKKFSTWKGETIFYIKSLCYKKLNCIHQLWIENVVVKWNKCIMISSEPFHDNFDKELWTFFVVRFVIFNWYIENYPGQIVPSKSSHFCPVLDKY